VARGTERILHLSFLDSAALAGSGDAYAVMVISAYIFPGG
jgi:hypothetical protein